MTAADHPSLIVPDLLQGQWTAAIVCSYTADLTFFETRLMNQLAQVPLRIVLADRDKLARTFEEAARTGQRHRLANKAYVAAPMRHPRAAHGKLILLLGARTGRLLVGSGNLGYDGYASPGELWHVFAYSEDQPQYLDEFAAARVFVDRLGLLGLVDPPVVELLGSAWGGSTWLPEGPSKPSLVRGNFDESILARLRAAVTDPVRELVAYAPFHDARCTALADLIVAFEPDHVRLLLTDTTSADPKAIERVLARARRATVERVHVRAEPETFLHAKWVHLIHRTSETLLTGSANLSRPAMLRPAAEGNIEIGVISTGPRGSFNRLYAHLERAQVQDVRSLGIGLQSALDDGPETGPVPVVLWSRLDGSVLCLTFSSPVPAADTVTITDHAGRTLTIASLQLLDNTARIVLTAEAAALAADGGRLVIRLGGDDENTSSTWPYHVAHLRGRLDRTAGREQLPRLGDLPEQDADLYELLRELDQTLIIDRESAWRIAKPSGRHDAGPPVSGETAVLEDLDWTRVRRDPRYGGYFARAARLSPTDVQVILAAIGGRLGELGMTADEPESETDDGELAREGDVGLSAEDEETDDELEDELNRRQLPISTRTRMAFDRFIRRYAAAIDDAAFIDELGPIPATTNAVVFNHLLVRLLERGAASPPAVLDAQPKTWRFLWGETQKPSMISALDSETADVVRQILLDSNARTATLRGLTALSDFASEDHDRMSLRDATRHVLTDAEFGLDGTTIATAAGSATMASVMLTVLARSAAPIGTSEVLDLVATPAGLRPSFLEWRVEDVRRVGRGSHRSTTLVVTKAVDGLTVDRAQELLGLVAVAGYYAGNDDAYFRIRFLGNDKDVAFWDEEAGTGTIRVGDEVADIDWIDPRWPGWSTRLDELEAQLSTLVRDRSAA